MSGPTSSRSDWTLEPFVSEFDAGLDRALGRVAAAELALARALLERDRAIYAAVRAGRPYAAVAAATGLSKARIGQITREQAAA
jgi:hypothetical protein